MVAKAKVAKAKIGVLGASGYTGAELLRLLLGHPQVDIRLLTADRRAGKPMADVFPQFAPFDLPTLQALDAVDWPALGLDLVFCALPHGTTQEVISDLFKRVPAIKVVDLSADFRIADPAAYAALVRASACSSRAAEAGRVRTDRNLSRQGQGGAACRQSGLLYELR